MEYIFYDLDICTIEYHNVQYKPVELQFENDAFKFKTEPHEKDMLTGQYAHIIDGVKLYYRVRRGNEYRRQECISLDNGVSFIKTHYYDSEITSHNFRILKLKEEIFGIWNCKGTGKNGVAQVPDHISNKILSVPKDRGLYLYKQVNGKFIKKGCIVTAVDFSEKVPPGIVGFDCNYDLLYNYNSKKYQVYLRANVNENVRYICVIESVDLCKWENLNYITIKNNLFDSVADNYYSLFGYNYPGCNLYIAFPFYFRKGEIGSKIYILFSADGLNWYKTGYVQENTTYKRTDIYSNENLVSGLVEINNQFILYITTDVKSENSVLKRYSLRKHGFCGIYSKDGYIITTLLQNISQLYINYIGNIEIHILDSNKKSIFRTTINGDYIDKHINITPIDKCYIKFILHDATLYSFKYCN